ncbi:integrase [Streptomyces davaonensis JCM 4913]|uniref:Integrase n=1 Tax=Streptomyces davaonensis (strain DSM 101723 / JCM 4913 / KCC S-0913 / 768) TaxID=1214101 RepID=K4QYP7_STRDJ|nr:site-specific integrase [Streptomyces davaonensis]CCK26047.1 integrase [Streptomyces davaonensis JCM 4913]
MATLRRRPNHSGTVTLRKDGRYQAAVYVPQPDGTTKRKYVYGKTYDEADRKRRQLVDRAQAGIPTPTRDMTVVDWLDYWLTQIVQPGRKRGTTREYSKRVRLYLRPYLGSKKLTSLTVADVRQLAGQVTTNVSAKAAKRALETLTNALNAALAEDIGLTRNVAAHVKVRTSAPKRPRWTLEELLRFLVEARKHAWYPIFLLIALLGLRRAEALGLRWSNIDFDQRVIWLESQIQRDEKGEYEDDLKTAGSMVPLPLPPQCVAPLRWQRLKHSVDRERAMALGWKWVETDLVFTTKYGTPIQGTNFLTTFKIIRARAGLSHGDLRTLRRGVGTLLVHLKVHPRVAKAILRHSRITMTMDVYAEAVDTDVREAVNQMDAHLRLMMSRTLSKPS